ncbi:hypothetical protein BJ912DRAFT_863255 [Pholiota molesta]|nr:hypothetical protein BJ912DRAFT_863255 [Pholiota molesta]
MNVDAGELANYCPACPQPGKNLRDNWKSDNNRYVYQRVFVADGNFKADHVKQKNGDDDIWLSEGGGMDPKRQEYQDFLAQAMEMFTVSPCENTFRAIINALIGSSCCDRTGKASIACARHGCYAPNALVDLFKGEQQKNIDFAFLQALKTTGVEPEQGAMLMYDIACQYFVHLKERLKGKLPQGLELDRAIGLFHVHAHKDQCFFRYASSFIPGTGVVSGEILECLWSTLNSISPTVRTATLAHRAEVLDDHACDSNHKKALGMANYLCRRHEEACTTVRQTEKYFNDISNAAGKDAIAMWNTEILKAERERLEDPAVMDIYCARISGFNGNLSTPEPVTGDPTIKDWLEFSITVEEKQSVIQYLIRRGKRDQRDADMNQVQKLRDALTPLLTRLRKLQIAAGVFEINAQHAGGIKDNLANWDDLRDEANVSSPAPVEDEADGTPEEDVDLCLPSNGNAPAAYRKMELQVRKNQAILELNQIRDLVANMSFRWTEQVRKAPRKDVRTRGRAVLKEMEKALSFRSQVYTRCRSRLVALGADAATLQHFQNLTKDDTKCSTAVLEPNLPGSTKLKLSWIWQSVTERVGPMADDEADPATQLEFRRVHWLRARAQLHRWTEERTLVRYEMEWTVRYFLHKSNFWVAGAETSLTHGRQPLPGAAAYARQQAVTWRQLAIIADCAFRSSFSNYKSPL